METKIKYFEILKNFLKKSGELALENQNHLINVDKPDGSIVTETDLTISRNFKNFIDENFENHYILDEETALKEKNLKQKTANSEYLWIIDPIDGTKPYFHGSDLFAIAISLYKNLKPVFGVIYLPAKDKIIYNDYKNVFYIQNAFKDDEIKKPLYFKKQDINKNSLVHFPVKYVKDFIKDYKFSFVDGYSAYIYAFEVFLNIAVGSFVKYKTASMWDLYSSLPIAKSLGLEMYNIDTRETLGGINFDFFDDKLKMKNIWLITSPEYKDELFSILK